MKQHVERRTEPRHLVTAKVTVLRSGGASIAADALNISASGMLLTVGEEADLRVGEEVTFEMELQDDPEQAFSKWGVAKIVRRAGSNLGIHLCAGTFELERNPPAE